MHQRVGELMRLISVVLILLLSKSTTTYAEDPSRNFLQMRGKRIIHPFIDQQDSLSSQEIVELSHENGLPVWFGRKVQKVVCLTGECQIANVWLFWNGAGNYLGFQLYNNEPLTKTDHVEFNSEDYLQLDMILSDPYSILKSTQLDDLIKSPDASGSVDGSSGATDLLYNDYIVENAAYTCYTLWHTVYGNTIQKVNSILTQRIDSTYLQLLLDQCDNEYAIWAIKQIAANPMYHKAFQNRIMGLILSDVYPLSQYALNYFTGDVLSDVECQQRLVNLFDQLSYRQQFQIVINLNKQEKINDQTIVRLLQLFDENLINAVTLRYVYRSIHAENLKNPAILQKVKLLANHDNPSVRENSLKLLEAFH